MSFKKICSIGVVVGLILFSCTKEEPLTPAATSAPNFDTGGGSSGGGVSSAFAWSEIAEFPGVERSNAIAFSINGMGYVGLGDDFPDYFDDFYRYDPQANTWTELDTFKGPGRRGAIQFVINDTAYVGLGWGETGSGSGFGLLGDLWKYDASSDDWIELDDPPIRSEGGSAFVVGSNAYVVTDDGEVFEYEPTTDTWTTKKEFFDVGITDRSSAVAFVVGSKAYYGTGYDESGGGIGGDRLNDLWAYTPSTDTWVERDSFPSARRNNAVSFVINGSGFVGTGNDFFSNYADFWYYTPSANRWTRANDFPGGGGSGLTAFTIGNTAYVGLGNLDSGGPLGGASKKFYKINK